MFARLNLIIYTTDKNLTFLEDMNIIHVDGTFMYRVIYFYQFFTIYELYFVSNI